MMWLEIVACCSNFAESSSYFTNDCCTNSLSKLRSFKVFNVKIDKRLEGVSKGCIYLQHPKQQEIGLLQNIIL